MNYRQTITLIALCAAVSACNTNDTSMMDGAITLKDNVVTLHVDGKPDALIDAGGALQIDGKPVAVTSSERGLLMLYVQSVLDVHQTGLDMGKIGAGIGAKELKDSLNGKSKAEKDQDAEAGTAQIKTLAGKMCQDKASMKSVQDQLAAQLPAFKPYGQIISVSDVNECKEDTNEKSTD
ncbi:hypothetical protein [Dyella monticola]|nr:hypothetical protein [Dyella monticola]